MNTAHGLFEVTHLGIVTRSKCMPASRFYWHQIKEFMIIAVDQSFELILMQIVFHILMFDENAMRCGTMGGSVVFGQPPA